MAAFLIIAMLAGSGLASGEPNNLAVSPQDTLKHLVQLRWANRVILARPAGEGTEMITRLQTAEAEIQDRHIAWFVFLENATITNLEETVGAGFAEKTIEQYFNSDDDRVILIGKDGGVKRRAQDLDLDDLFGLIDTMPMRRREMGK
jgi:hypothetical protein